MAHFIGKLNGARGPASRLGTKNSGMEVIAASWNGAVKTTLYHNASDGRDYAQVALIPWHGKGVSRILYDGPVDKPADEPSPFNGRDVKRADVNKYADEQAERHEAEKRHEEGDIGFMVSIPDRGVIHVDRDPVSNDQQGDR